MFKVSALLVSCLILSACHSDTANPLLTHPPDEAAKVIYEADMATQQETKVYGWTGTLYDRCTRAPDSFTNPFTHQDGRTLCDKLFKNIVENARRHSGYENLTLADLKSPAVEQKLGRLIENYFSTQGQTDHIPGVNDGGN